MSIRYRSKSFHNSVHQTSFQELPQQCPSDIIPTASTTGSIMHHSKSFHNSVHQISFQELPQQCPSDIVPKASTPVSIRHHSNSFHNRVHHASFQELPHQCPSDIIATASTTGSIMHHSKSFHNSVHQTSFQELNNINFFHSLTHYYIKCFNCPTNILKCIPTLCRVTLQLFRLVEQIRDLIILVTFQSLFFAWMASFRRLHAHFTGPTD